MPDNNPPPGGVPPEWFSPDPPRDSPRLPPGVVYTASGPPPSGRSRGAYDGLRELGSDEPLWPMEDPGQPPATPPRSSLPPFLIGLMVGVTLAVVSVAVFQLLANDDNPTVPPPTVSAASSTTTLATTTTTTEATTTTTTTAPPPVQTLAPPAPIEPVGNALDIGDLRMASNGIGPVLFGNVARQALGILVASLGPPDDDSGLIVSDGAFGACPGDTVRLVRWGPLMTVSRLEADGDLIFAGYRLDLALGGLDSRASTLSTLSGLRAGDTVAELNTIYESFTIEFFDEPGVGLMFELYRAGDATILLRGPITSQEDDGKVTGIWGPDACR